MALAQLDPQGPTRDPEAPAWVCVLLGWTLVTAWLERAAAADTVALSHTAWVVESDPKGAGHDRLVIPRSLRALEGLGELRALDVARHLWSARSLPGAGWSQLESIPGVGPALAIKLRQAHARGL